VSFDSTEGQGNTMAASADRGAATQEASGSLRYIFDRLADRPRGPRTVSNAIMESWQRSVDAGLDPHEIRPPPSSARRSEASTSPRSWLTAAIEGAAARHSRPSVSTSGS
jgi:hypothetical protein